MYKIYCLVNPFTFEPFYVGATNKPLHKRLLGHVSSRNVKSYGNSVIGQRNNYIIDIIKQGKKPLISLLFVTDIHNVDKMELFCYNYLKSFGFQLIQNQYRFTYSGHYCKNILKINA